jgi:hypothetical protein
MNKEEIIMCAVVGLHLINTLMHGMENEDVTYVVLYVLMSQLLYLDVDALHPFHMWTERRPTGKERSNYY